jgi:hypothetical protein
MNPVTESFYSSQFQFFGKKSLSLGRNINSHLMSITRQASSLATIRHIGFISNYPLQDT